MNIETLIDYIQFFKTEVVRSGFRRDIQDYISSLGNYQNNIVTLRDVASKVKSTLDRFHSGDLPEALKKLLPKKELRPFTESDHLENLNELITDSEIQQGDFYNKFSKILNKINEQLTQNQNEIERLEKFLIPYHLLEERRITDENKAIVSLIFKDTKTISNLKEFSKTNTNLESNTSNISSNN